MHFCFKKKPKNMNRRCSTKYAEITARDYNNSIIAKSPPTKSKTFDEITRTVLFVTSYTLSVKYSAVLVLPVLPAYVIRKQRDELAVRAFQEIDSPLLFQRHDLASLTSSVGGSTHDGCYPGNLTVGNAVNSLELFKVDCESFRKGICKPN